MRSLAARTLLVTSVTWLVAVTSPPARAETVTLVSVSDNTLFESDTGSISSGSGPAIFCGLNSGETIRRALLRFDVAAELPADAVVDSVKLELTISNVSNEDPTFIDVHRVLADWGEGKSSSNGGSGAPAASMDATWLHTFYPTSFWAAPGGDFDPGVRASATVTGTGVYVWSDSALADDVQAWYDAPATNFGWMLRGDEATPSSAKRIDSREVPEQGARPRLVVHFHVETTPVARVTWGRTKEIFR